MHCNGDCLLLTTTETIYFEIIEREDCHALLTQPEICGKPYHNTVALSPKLHFFFRAMSNLALPCSSISFLRMRDLRSSTSCSSSVASK